MSTRQAFRAASGGSRAEGERQPFHGAVLDLAIADRTQVELFAAVGRTRGPFHGVVDWPYLNGLVQDRSRSLLASQGEAAWKAAGGVYGEDGRPTFSVRSACAAQLVQQIAGGPGGFIWTDSQGTGWAVRLVAVNAGGPGTYGGLALSWNGGGRVIDPVARQEYRRAVEQQIAELEVAGEAETRRQLRQVAERMWLYERGEQLLWAVHAAVLMQRRSVVLLPDVGLGEVVWGGDRAAWPDNWRGSIADVLGSLTQLHLAVLQVGGGAWKPQFTMRSVAVASFEDLERNRKQGGFCRPACPLWNRPEPHDHFLVQIGYGFLGLLENFAVRDQQGARQFDFAQKRPAGEEGKALVAARKRGEIVPVHLPTKVFGPSAWSGLTGGQRGILTALVREVTRVRKKGQTDRRDRADVLAGNRVPDARGRRQVVCPLLRPDGRYVAFNGNGLRRGLGYLVVGRKRQGWLARCGYVGGTEINTTWAGKHGVGRTTRQFLGELDELAGLLGLTVVGLAPTTGAWLTLAQARELAALPNGLKALSQIHLRVYGPEDYLDRWRCLFAERGGFSAIPGADGPAVLADADALPADGGVGLKVRLRRAGLSQDDLARHLGVTKSFVSMLLTGKKAWPAGMRERAEAFVSGTVAPDEVGRSENLQR
jgi:hypothetical protein